MSYANLLAYVFVVAHDKAAKKGKVVSRMSAGPNTSKLRHRTSPELHDAYTRASGTLTISLNVKQTSLGVKIQLQRWVVSRKCSASYWRYACRPPGKNL